MRYGISKRHASAKRRRCGIRLLLLVPEQVRADNADMFRYLATAIIAVSLAFLPAFAQTKPAPSSVDVELLLRGPDSQPVVLADAAISFRQGKELERVSARTDGAGIAHFQLPAAGRFRLLVKVHDVGYGQTDLTDFVPGMIARPTMPVLIPYATLDGTVPLETCDHDVKVSATTEFVALPPTTADSAGHFHFDDVEPGEWFLTATADGVLCAEVPKRIPLRFGQPRLEVKLPSRREPPGPAPTAKPQPVESAPPATHGSAVKSSAPVVWVHGIVRDHAGHPVKDARVFVLGTYYGGIRMMEAVAKATTDADGYYELKGAGGLPSFSGTVLATAEGHPPAWAWPAFAQIDPYDRNPPNARPVEQDLVLPSEYGELSVTVVQDGKPVGGASVAVYLEGAALRGTWAMGAGGAVRQELEDVAYPAGVADGNGAVHFDRLLPGRYTIYALAPGGATIRNFADSGGTGRAASAVATGIPVRIGEVAHHKLSLFLERQTVHFKILGRDGSAVTGNTPIQFGSVDRIERASTVLLDNGGLGHWDFDHVGLWDIHFVRRDDYPGGGLRMPADFREPNDVARAFFAVSPNLSKEPVPTFQVRHVEAPSAHVSIRDAAGKPVRASVKLSAPFGELHGIGAADGNGEIVFRNLISGQEYSLFVFGTELTKVRPIEWGYNDMPLPTVDKLATQYAIPRATFVALPGTDHKILLRPEPLGYIYGTIRSRTQRNLDGWTFWPSIEQQKTAFSLGAGGPYSRILPGTAQFVTGPYLAGPVKLTLGYKGGGDPRSNPHLTIPVVVDATKPTHLDIDLDQYADAGMVAGTVPLTGAPQAYLGMGGISSHTTGAQHLVGKVFLSDGITPALGAQVLYFEAEQRYPAISAMTDALGDLRPRGLWSGPALVSTKAESPASQALVAFLPGSRGATVYSGPVEHDKPLRFVLPPAISVSGRVTVGSKSPLRRPGVIHVLAAYQGKGALNPALSVETTADADGTFTLAGLTPGTYLVQAALDDIWLSSVSTLHVNGASPRPIRLAIPLPGAPVRVEIRDGSGVATVGHSITIERSGPLAGLWPREIITDGTGSVYLPTLEAGRQTLLASGAAKPVHFRVPPLPAEPVVLHVTLSRPPVRERASADRP